MGALEPGSGDPESTVRNNRHVALVGLSLALSAGAARAQEVRFEPRSGERTDQEIARFLEGPYQLWTRDTVLAPEQTVRGDVLVLEGAARIAGTIEGSIYVVDGDLFLRPGARIAGDVVVVGGGYYGSGLAAVEGRVEYRPNVALAVMPEEGGYRIYAVEEPLEPFQLHGLYGFGLPTYQRVDAVTLSWGATARAVNWAWRPDLSVDGRIKTGPADFEGTARQFWHPSRSVQFGFEVERATRNNEGWIWGTLINSLSYFFAGEDVRDYYRADRFALTIERPPGPGLSPSFTFQYEDADSLVAESYFVLFDDDDDVRPNPPVDVGETVSGIFSLTHRTRKGEPGLNARVLLEGATSDVAGDFSFLLGELRARWDHPTIAGQQLKAFVEARGDLAGSLPRQRWSALGGVGTLPTFRALEFRGPRLLYGQLSYFLPLVPWARESSMVNFVFHGRVGSAWDEGETAVFEANLLFGLRVFFVEGGVAVDPRSGRVKAELVLSGDRLGGIVVP